MPVMLSFWGKEENKSAVMEKLARRGFTLNPRENGATGKNELKFLASIPFVFVKNSFSLLVSFSQIFMPVFVEFLGINPNLNQYYRKGSGTQTYKKGLTVALTAEEVIYL